MAQIKRYYPIEGRKDFFKYVIIATGESVFNDNARLHKNMKGEAMYFDDRERAVEVRDAINTVEIKRNYKPRYRECPYCHRIIPPQYSFEEHKELCKNVDVKNLIVKKPTR